MHESPSPARSTRAAGVWELCFAHAFCSGPPAGIKSARKVGEVGGGAAIGTDLGPFQNSWKGSNLRYRFFGFFSWPRRPGGMITV